MSDLERNLEGWAGWRRTAAIVGFIVILLAVMAMFVVGIFSSRRASNEREASIALKKLSSAEADFRANDRDWNHVNDFWTADVKGLYTMTSAAVPGARPHNAQDPSVKLIEVSVAAPDADGNVVPAGGENVPLSAFAEHRARSGYWYLSLLHDHTLQGSPEMIYMDDTGGKPPMGRVHNTSKFGFVSFPDSKADGSWVYIVNENNTIFRLPLIGEVRLGKAVPPGRKGLAEIYQNWPDDDFYKKTFAEAAKEKR